MNLDGHANPTRPGPCTPRALRRDLAAAAAANPLLRLVDVATGHDVHLEDPEAVAGSSSAASVRISGERATT